MKIETKHDIGESVIYWDYCKGTTQKVKVRYIRINCDGIYYALKNDWTFGRDWNHLVEEKYLFKSKEEALKAL